MRSYKSKYTDDPDPCDQASVLTTQEPSACKVSHRRRWLSCVHWRGCWLQGRSQHPSNPSSSPNSPFDLAKCSESHLDDDTEQMFSSTSGKAKPLRFPWYDAHLVGLKWNYFKHQFYGSRWTFQNHGQRPSEAQQRWCRSGESAPFRKLFHT